MPQSYAASVQGVAIRVTRLDSVGNPMFTVPGMSYVTGAFIRTSFTPEYEEGDEITEKNAAGEVCVSFKAADTLKRVTMEIAICEPDPEFSQIVGGGVLLTENFSPTGTPPTDADDATQGLVVGLASPQVGEDPSGDGVAVEVWSNAVSAGKRSAVKPYFHWVFPYVKVRQSGDRAIENGLMANTFEGFGLGNINFGNGPDGKWLWPAVVDRPYAYARVDTAPTGLKGMYTWDDTTGVGTRVDSLVGVTGFGNSGRTPVPAINIPDSDDYDNGQPDDYILEADNVTTWTEA